MLPEPFTHTAHICELTQIPSVITLSLSWIGLATKAAPIVCEKDTTNAGKLQKRCKVGNISVSVPLQLPHSVDLCQHIASDQSLQLNVIACWRFTIKLNLQMKNAVAI